MLANVYLSDASAARLKEFLHKGIALLESKIPM